jgi:hypothetical protein
LLLLLQGSQTCTFCPHSSAKKSLLPARIRSDALAVGF